MSTSGSLSSSATEWKPIAESLGQEFVTLIVGNKRKEFTVHKKLISEASDYFRRAFDGSFREGHEGKIYMAEESPSAAGLFVEWLYRSQLPIAENAKQFNGLLKLYLMSEMMCMNGLADKTMTTILESLDCSVDVLTHEIVSYIWGQTKAESPLRKFCIEVLAYDSCETDDSNPRIYEEVLDGLWLICKDHKDFFKRFFMYFESFDQGFHTPPNPCGARDPKTYCRFHYHDKKDTCDTKKLVLFDRPMSETYWAESGDNDDFFADLPSEKVGDPK